MNDPIGLVETAMDPSHVDSVSVAGRFAKRAGRLLGVDVRKVPEEAEAVRDAVLARIRPPGRWPGSRALPRPPVP